MKNVLLLDGIGDYSVIKNQYKKNSPDYFILTIAEALKEYYSILYLDLRDKQFNKNKIHEKIREFIPDFTFIKCTSVNILNIRNLELEGLQLKNSFLICFNNDYNINASGIELLKFKSLVLNNKVDIYTNIIKIFEVVGENIETKGFSLNEIMPWNTINNFENKTILLNSGYGCKRKCSFCSISNSNCGYVKLDLLMKEIDYLIIKGVKYFHLSNHNISYNIDFIENFCVAIINKYTNFDLAWSCCLIPEEIAKAPKIIKLLKKAKCEVIELNVFSIDVNVLKSLQIIQTREDILNIVNDLYNENISSIIINYIIGFPEETNQSLMELLKFSENLINIAPGIVEFNMVYFENSFELLNDLKTTSYSSNTLQLTKDHFSAFRSYFYAEIFKSMGKSIHRMNIKQRIAHCELYNKNIRTQYFIYFISKSSTYSVFNITSTVVSFKYSWNIDDDILNYCPFCHVLPVANREKLTLMFDPQLADHEKNTNELILNEVEESLFNFSKEYTPLREIIIHIERENKLQYHNAFEIVLNFYTKLESLDLILYTKVL